MCRVGLILQCTELGSSDTISVLDTQPPNRRRRHYGVWGMRDLGRFLLRNWHMNRLKMIFHELFAAYAVLLVFFAVTLILTYLNISQVWEPFVLEHLTHQDLTTAG